MEVHACPATTWDTAYQVEVAPTSKTADMWYWFFSLNDKQQEQQKMYVWISFFCDIGRKRYLCFFHIFFSQPSVRAVNHKFRKKSNVTLLIKRISSDCAWKIMQPCRIECQLCMKTKGYLVVCSWIKNKDEIYVLKRK